MFLIYSSAAAQLLEGALKMARRRGFHPGFSLVFALVIISSIRIVCQAQIVPGFVSIDCGSKTPHNDSVTQFLWETDDKYVFTGTNGNLTGNVSDDAVNSKALHTFRYFPEKRAKFCYELPVTQSNSNFLIRAMFLHGGSSLLTLPITFDVYVNSTFVATVKYGIYDEEEILNKAVVVEGIFPCPGTVAYVCLGSSTGIPFISSLEFRLLDHQNIMYTTEWGAKTWLFSLMRYNCGVARNASAVRYPDDKFDRLWLAPGDWADGLQAVTNSTSTPSQASSAEVNNVPPKVMQDAWLNDTANSSITFTIPTVLEAYSVYAAVYTEELQLKDDGNRKFRVFVGGLSLDTFMVPTVEHPKLATSSEVNIYDSRLNFTLVARDRSILGPIVNAVEAYIVYGLQNWSTHGQDVAALADLQAHFNLTGWQGDPCERVSWDWLGCTSSEYTDDEGYNYYVARVTKIFLSNKGINSTIPASILLQLVALTEIHLNNNFLYGSIPESLTSIDNLTLLFVDNNDLSGEIPQALQFKLLNFSYKGNERLEGFSPPSLSPSPSVVPPPPPPTSTKKKKSNKTAVIIGATAGGVVGLGALLSLSIWYYCCRRPKNPKNNAKKEVSLPGIQNSGESANPAPPLGSSAGYVSYETVRLATDDFKEEIGKGSYGAVYRGWLNNQEVAVKLNSIQSDQGIDEFVNEVEILTRVHHRNLVSLCAYCNEGTALILIYEYQVNGTLREWLRGEKRRGSLNWIQRLRIAADGAMGLDYLHNKCKPSIIHRDVKSSNILLDDTLTAKVADFGLSKKIPIASENSREIRTNVKGTLGYLDPEYIKLHVLTHKSDVYSYGVVIAEIITGRPPFMYKDRNPVPTFVLLEWLRKSMARSNIQALADPYLQGRFNPEAMWKMAEIALACVNPLPERRPNFSQIVRSINEAMEIEGPMAQNRPSLLNI